jgi:hypothetical protein
MHQAKESLERYPSWGMERSGFALRSEAEVMEEDVV